jgi:hypothetical protein
MASADDDGTAAAVMDALGLRNLFLVLQPNEMTVLVEHGNLPTNLGSHLSCVFGAR